MYIAPAEMAAEFLKEQDPQRTDAPGLDELLENAMPKFIQVETKGTEYTLCTCNHGWVRASDDSFDTCPNNCHRGIIWIKINEKTAQNTTD